MCARDIITDCVVCNYREVKTRVLVILMAVSMMPGRVVKAMKKLEEVCLLTMCYLCTGHNLCVLYVLVLTYVFFMYWY